MRPKISVIVPVYKAEKYIHECIDSILTQSFTDIELLHIDDGSPDSCGWICDEYANKDTRVRVFHKENEGVSSARNLGLENAQGDWIVFVDADDYLFNNSLGTLMQAVNRAECDIALACAYRYEQSEYIPIYQIENKESDDICDLYEHYALWAYIFKRKLIEKHNIKFVNGLAYSEDMLFIIEYVSCCKRIKQIKDFVYVYRINETSACKSLDWKKKTMHQFWSASLLQKYINKSKEFNIFYKKARRQVREKINLGISCFVDSPSQYQFKVIKELFNKYFNNREYSEFIFFIDYMCILCKFYIRKIVK